MANVTEHDPEKEWESDAREKRRVHLFILRHVKKIDDNLEAKSELIGNDVGGRADVGSIIARFKLVEPWHLKISRVLLVDIFQRLHGLGDLPSRNPTETQEEVTCLSSKLVQSHVYETFSLQEKLI